MQKLLAGLALLLSCQGSAYEGDAIRNKQERLREQLKKFDLVKPHIEREDMGRFLRIKLISEKTLAALSDAEQLSDGTATEVFRKFSTVYARAELLLQQISSKRFEKTFNEILQIGLKLFPKLSVYTYHTKELAKEIEQLIRQVLETKLPDELRKTLEVQVGELADLNGRDSWPTYENAIPVGAKIRALRQQFWSFSQKNPSHPAIDLLWAIQGTNDEMIDLAGIERPVSDRKPKDEGKKD